MKKYIFVVLVLILITGCAQKIETTTTTLQESGDDESIDLSDIENIEGDLDMSDIDDFEQDLENFDF